MNLYLCKRHDRVYYDEYIGDVVAAPDEAAAIALSQVAWQLRNGNATIKLIGVAVAGIEPGVVLDSFRAG